MTTSFGRLGSIESRLASALCSPRRPRKPNWVCADCRQKGAQRRPTTTDAGRSLYEGRGRESAQNSFSWIEEAVGKSWRTVDSLWERVRRLKPDSQSPDTVVEEPSQDLPTRYSHSRSYPYERDGFDYKAELPAALARGDPDAAVRAFLAAAEDKDFVRGVPPATFTALLRLLDPVHFIENAKLVHNEMSAHYARQLHIYPVQDVLADFIHIVRDVTAARKSAGVPLGLMDYKLLLKCAGAVGDKEAAKGIWEDLREDRLIPDTDCYNYYLTSVIWNQHYRARARQKLRITQNNWTLRGVRGWRRWLKVQWSYNGFRIGKGGIKEEVTRVFQEMLRRGNMPNERTFILMMSGLAREGDVAGLKAILLKVWNVDVDAIMGRGKNKHRQIQVTPYPEGSPLHPGQGLLFMVAHCFGINNDIPTALRVVDLISRNYGIVIARDTWAQLFEWTFVLSLSRSGTKMYPGQKMGQLPYKALEELWNTMTGEPYNVAPSITMYNRLIRNMTRRYRKWEDLLPIINKGRLLYRKSILAYRRALRNYTKASRAHEAGLTTWKSLEVMKRDLEYLSLVKRRNHLFVRRWTRLFLGCALRWRKRDSDWERGEVSRFLRKMGAFAPTRVGYWVSGGRLEFTIRSRAEVMASHARRHADALPLDPVPPQLSAAPKLVAWKPMHPSEQQAPLREKAPVDRMEELMRAAAARYGVGGSPDQKVLRQEGAPVDHMGELMRAAAAHHNVESSSTRRGLP